MKKLFIITICALALFSCEQANVSDVIADTETQKQSKEVMFVMKGIVEEYSTRATLASVNMTDLWVWEGTTLLAHKVSTDSDFDTPSINLTYGSHDLTFVSSKADSQSWANGVWSATKIKDTFAKQMNVTVSGNSSNSRQVQLARRSSQLCFQIEDVIPSGVKMCHMTAGNHLSLSSLLACGTATEYDVTIDIADKVGQTYQPVMNLLTASATDEEDCDVMIEFLNASNAVLYHFERTIKLKANRCTTLKGKYFSGSSNEVSVDETWLSELVVDLYQ